MELRGTTVVVTGGGDGIGKAMCLRFAREGAAAVVVADIDGDAARDTADQIGGIPHRIDAGEEADVVAMFRSVVEQVGTPHLICANAGTGADGDLDAPPAVWERAFRLNVYSHVLIARHGIPLMAANGGGYLLHTASAAGLLSMPGALPYAASKHAAVAIAEYVAIAYARHGIKVSCLCPQAVDTRLLNEQTEPRLAELMRSVSDVISADEVAAAVVDGLRAERFLILPHGAVADHYRRRAADPDRWLAGMRRLVEASPTGGNASVSGEPERPSGAHGGTPPRSP